MVNRIEYSKSKNVRYDIDEENGVVRATLKCIPTEPQDLFDSIILKYELAYGPDIVETSSYIYEHLKIEPYYSGIARCHPDDVFNLDVGKEIALRRAKAKYLRAMAKKFEYMCKHMDDMLVEVEKRWNNLLTSGRKNSIALNKLLLNIPS